MTMRIAYVITAYDDPSQLARLVAALGPQSFFVHIDGNVYDGPFKNTLPPGDHVHYVSPRVKVNWGGYTQVESLKRALSDVLSSGPYDRVVVLSGMDYPIVSADEIERRFSQDPDHEWLRARLVTGDDGLRPKVVRYWRFDLGISNPLLARIARMGCNRIWGGFLNFVGKRKRDVLSCGGRDMSIYFGSDYYALTWSTACGLYRFLNDRDVEEYFKTSYAPSELVAATYVCNSVAHENVDAISGKCRYEQLCALHYEVYDPIIKVMDEADYEDIVASGKMFFRKARSGVSDGLIGLLDSEKETGRH